MKKFIIAILAVITLQLTFQLLVANDPPENEYAAARQIDPVGSYTNSNAEFDAIPADFAPVTVGSEIRPRLTPKHHEVYVPERRALVARHRVDREVMPTFRPSTVTIDVPRHPAIEFSPVMRPMTETASVETRIARFEEKSEGRSLIAKALPVIKKPYEWVKGVVSKLK